MPSPDQPFPLPGPNDMLPYEPTEGMDGTGMINATLFRKMGPEMAMKDGQYQYEGPKSWSNSPNGQNKKPEEGAPDNKGAPPGEQWAPKKEGPYMPDLPGVTKSEVDE